MQINQRNLEEQFFQSLAGCGITPKEIFTPIFDGQIHRFTIEGNKSGSLNGAYKGYSDGRPTWFIQDWHEGGTMKKFTYDFTDDERRDYGRENHSSEERERQRREAEARKAEEEKRQEENQQRARARAWDEYQNAWGLGHALKHAYLQSRFTDKNIFIPDSALFDTAFRIKIAAQVTKGICKLGDLLIPIVDAATRNFQTLQRIPLKPNEDGKFIKKFYPGIPPNGGCHELIPRNSENYDRLFICEGFCTGLAVLIITGGKFPVFCAMSASNIPKVARSLRERYDGKAIIIAADNDKKRTGILYAEKTQKAGDADDIITPKIEGRDWYDELLFMRLGKE